MHRVFFALSVVVAVLVPSMQVMAQVPAEARTVIEIRGRKEFIYFYPATGPRLNSKVLFLPGDGGLRGYATTIARRIASFGHDVYCLDTKDYLESFTGKTNLKESEVMSDLGEIARSISNNTAERFCLVGWSEGAGLCLLAAASEDNKKIFDGLITLGLGESNVLGWRWIDDITYITKKDPNEPAFQSADYMARVAPLPFLMIQSTGDEYVSVQSANLLFARAAEPKQMALIEASSHRFDGNQEELYRRLKEGLAWIKKRSC